MRTIISTLAIFLMAAAMSLNAQPRNGNGYGMNGINPFVAQHGSELNLTEDQMREIASLSLEFKQEFRSNRPGNRGRRGAFRNGRRVNQSTEWTDTRAEYHAKVMDILTDDQKQILRSTMQERAESAHQFRTIRHEVLLDEAGFEGEKRQQVLNLMNEHSEQLLDARMENLETPGNIGQFRSAGFESRTELQSQLKELLTVTEYQKLQEVMGTPFFGNNVRSGRKGGVPRFNQ